MVLAARHPSQPAAASRRARQHRLRFRSYDATRSWRAAKSSAWTRSRSNRSWWRPRARALVRVSMNVFEDPRSHIVYEDAKTFFAASREPYDLIVSEPSNPWVSGVATLFSDEFYGGIARHLRPDGYFTQWLQIYETNINVVGSIMKALTPPLRCIPDLQCGQSQHPYRRDTLSGASNPERRRLRLA